MPDYLSPAWFSEADALLRSDSSLQERSRGVRLILEQRVADGDRIVVWQVRFHDGIVSMHEGSDIEPDVVFVSDLRTALAIRSGELGAQAAFIAGDLRIDGSVAALMEHGELFAALDDVLGPLR